MPKFHLANQYGYVRNQTLDKARSKHFGFSCHSLSDLLATIYYFHIWDLIGKKQNLLGYLPIFTYSSHPTTLSWYLVYQLFLPRKKLMDLSLSLSPNTNQSHGAIVRIFLSDIFGDVVKHFFSVYMKTSLLGL